MKILAVIPARGGSKAIPRKNCKLLAGRPLLSYIIDCAKHADLEMDVVVTTDDEEIKTIALQNDAKVVDRPKELATDEVTLDPVVWHALLAMEKRQNLVYDLVITLQPTAPLLSAKTLTEAVSFSQKSDVDTLISAVNDPRLSWREENGQIVPNYEKRQNRQYLPKEWKETGAFVITKRCFVNSDSRFGKKISVFEVPEEESVDIDTMKDWYVCEYYLGRQNK